MVAEIAWRVCMTATRWGYDQFNYHICIVCKILSQYDGMHGLICLVVAEIAWRGCVAATRWGYNQWKPYICF